MATVLLEVIATSREDAIEAEQGGADRLELAADLDRDGLTPSLATVEDVLQATSLPVRVMLRNQPTMSVGSEAELAQLAASAERLAQLPINGLVMGFVEQGAVDVLSLRRLLEAAPGIAVTFHRAFEQMSDPEACLQTLARWPQIDRVLVRPTQQLSLGQLRNWQHRQRFIIAAGLGTAILEQLPQFPTLTEVHAGRAVRQGEQASAPVVAAKVAALKSRLA